ncbi:MAG: Gfo/Idh/MocA family oxidoreductase [Hyphomicrobiales bacterium]|nr:Gfo/Idh/MocA family oxidoreductase [Hyphomicrobiales bacterium]
MNDHSAIAWGIIGPGSIAKQFAAAIPSSETGRLAAIATRDPSRAGLAEGFPGARIVDGYEAILADPDVEALYIATPHSSHAQWAIRAAEAGKHVLCEKPMGVSAAEAEAMINAADKAGTFLAEAFMNRVHPLTHRLVELLHNGVVGDVRIIKMSFGFRLAEPDPTHRLLANDTAGGAVLDVGCYCASLARLAAGAAAGAPFLDPVEVRGVGHFGPTGVDEWAAATLKFPGDVIAQLSASITVAQDNQLRIFGTEGWISIAEPWVGTGRNGGTKDILIHRPDGPVETVVVDEPRPLYSFEIDAVGRAIRAGQTQLDPPGATWADTLGNMNVLDRWRAEIGLEYGFEKPGYRTEKIDGRPLSRPSAPMRRRPLRGLGREASVVALGGANFTSFSQAAIICDAFFERGGNVLDSAWIYGSGLCDKLLGAWMASRGVRDDIILIGKGAHAPLTYPDVIATQLTESLDRLQTDTIDAYFMHRDNLDIPVGEFVDAMDAEVRAGRIRIYGGSNWSRERMDAASAYAEANDRQPPGALSNNFSLAEMVEPVWEGVVSSSDDAWKAWQRQRQIPNFAWSSQARGFFTDRAAPEKTEDTELVNGWYSEKNFARRQRAIELGTRLGKSPLHVALAYCLAQDFPVIPLIGPLAIGELEDSLEALDIELSPDEVRWLEDG